MYKRNKITHLEQELSKTSVYTPGCLDNNFPLMTEP